MQFSEWSLTAFTILVQLCAGFYLAFSIFDLSTRKKYGSEGVVFIGERSFIIILMILLAAAGISFFHLGKPFNAFFVFSNINGSWLSREIALLGLFIIASSFVAMIYHKNYFTSLIRSGFVGITAIIGLTLVYTMAKIYMLPTIPTWNSSSTPASFLLTMFMLGAGTVFVFLYYEYIKRIKAKKKLLKADNKIVKKILKYVIFLGFTLLSLEIAINILQAADFVNRFNIINEEGFIANSGLIWLLRTRIILAFLGLALMIYSFNKSLKSKMIKYKWVVLIALVFVALSEILGRFFFYSIYLRIGI